MYKSCVKGSCGRIYAIDDFPQLSSFATGSKTNGSKRFRTDHFTVETLFHEKNRIRLNLQAEIALEATLQIDCLV